MQATIQCGKIIGKVTNERWVQVHDFTPKEHTKLQQRGRLVAILALESDEGQVRMAEVGREALARLHECYFGNETDKPGVALRHAVAQIEEEFDQIELGCLAFCQEVVYTVGNKGIGVWGKVGVREAWVIEGKDEGITSLAGRLIHGEVLVMGNSQFWKEISLGMVRAAVERKDGNIEEAVETLAIAERGRDTSGGEVGVVVGITLQPANLNHEYEREEEPEREHAEEVGEEIIPFVPHTARVLGAEKRDQLWKKIKAGMAGIVGKGEVAVYVDSETVGAQRRKNMLLGSGFLIVMVIFLVGGKFRSEKIAQETSVANLQLEDIRFLYNEAQALVVLNPIRSRELVAQIRSKLDALGGDKSVEEEVGRIKNGLLEIEKTAAGVKQVEMKEVVDLGLVREGMMGEKIELEEGGIVILDTVGSRVVRVNPGSGSARIVAGEEGMGKAMLVTTYPGKVMVFSDKGIVEVNETRAQVKVEKDDGWGSVKDMGMFAGNIYLLAEEGKIWRHPGSEGSYGKKSAWIADGGEVSASGGVSMAIDGSIWVWRGNGTLAKFIRGVGEEVALSGVDKAPGQGAVLYTGEEVEKLYVLDKEVGRIVMISKAGEYLGVLEGEQLKGATDLAVDEKKGKIYVVGNTKVWQGDL